MSAEKPYTNTAEKLLSDLRRRYRKLTRENRLASLFLSAGIFLVGFTLLLLAEQAFWLTSGTKSILLILIAVIAVSAGWWFSGGWLVSGNRSYPDFTRFYRSFCEKHNFRELENALDLYLDPSEKKSRLHLLAIERNLQVIDRDRFQEQLTRFASAQHVHRKYMTALGVLVISLLLAGVTSWSNSDSFQRTYTFWEDFEKPNPWEFVITPGDTTLEHGSNLQPEIEFSGGSSSLPSRVSLVIKTDIEEEFRHRPMEPDGDQTFRAPPVELTNDASWYILMDDFESEPYQVNVQLRPRFEALAANVEPPAYTGLSGASREYPFAQLRAYGGSEITIEGKFNKPVDESELRIGSESLQLEVTDEDSLTFEATFTLSQSDTLRFSMQDHDGLANQNPFRFTVNLLEDEYPVVAIREPEDDLQVPEPDRLDIFYQASDDFGLTRADLHWELQRAFTDEPTEGSMSLSRPETGETQHVPWELDELDLRPRDELTFWISVWDNDEFNGYKVSESQRIRLEVPSLSAWMDDVGERERGVQDALDNVSESHQQMEEEYQRFRERLTQNEEPGWEEQQMLDDIQDRQQEMDDAVNRLNEQFEEIRNEIENSSQVSDETRQAYHELQELMEQLDDPALLEALEELRRSMEDLNSQELQRAMEDFEFNDQVYKERLERTLELFKTLKMNSDLDRLAAQYENLAERMHDVAGEEKSLREQHDEQQSVREDMEPLEKQLEDLDSRPPQRSEERLRQLKEETLGELREIQETIDELINRSREDTNDETAAEQSADGESADGGEGSDDGSEGSADGGEESADRDGSSADGGEDSGEGGEDADSDGEVSPESGQDQDSSRQQQEISEQLQARADALRQEQQQMSGQQIQVNILALQQSLYTLLELSEVQEELSRQTTQTESRSQGYVELARGQQNIRSQFSRVADTLFQVSAEIPSLSSLINIKKAEIERTLSNSVEQMAERDQRASVLTSRESLGGINELASLLAEAIDQLMNQQSGAGGGNMSLQQMIEQMQNMSGDQEMMNQQLQDLINDAQGERLTQEQSERLDQLAHQQNQIRQQLQELQRSGALRDGDRTLSELQRMAEEMEDSINDMRGGVTDPLMSERQQNILSRMLSAEESLQQRGESDEYEGRSPEEFDRTMPPEISLEEIEQEIRTRLQDPDYTRFHDDYQRLIERYFELLRRMENGQIR